MKGFLIRCAGAGLLLAAALVSLRVFALRTALGQGPLASVSRRPTTAAPPPTAAATTAKAGATTSAVPPASSTVEAATRPPEPTEPLPAVAPVSPTVTASDADIEQLRARALVFPVEGVLPREMRDTFSEGRDGHQHEAVDILAPRGTRVLAVDDGRVAKLFTSVRGGLTVYQFDPTETYCYYYAHLDRYAEGLKQGAFLRRGALVGYVGTTGNAAKTTPHLHFALFKLGLEKRWWEGTALNPYGLWSHG
jgi:murein DD-endopeptidase MepM/ murein hydrolase activator NlpD